MVNKNLIELYQNSFRENWDSPALTDYIEKTSLTYGQTACEIAKLHLLFDHCKLQQGDKVALIGRNTPNWAITFMAAITYGAIVVPILQDFNPADVHHIVNHSDAILLFVSDQIWENLEEEKMELLHGVVSLNDFRTLCQRDGESITKFQTYREDSFKERYPKGFDRKDICYATIPNERLMLINYTSGTTGFSKGVMLSGTSIAANVIFGINSRLHYAGSKCLSFLPLAHAYGCAFDFLVPMAVGTHVTLLGKIPSPKIILKALEEVKPNLIISVPLILEKLYRKQIQPLLNKRSMRWAVNIPLLDTKIYNQVRKKLIDAFGGEFEQIIIGGAPINPEVEQFLRKIKFPITVGYGMTECAPLISYAHHSEFTTSSSGKVLDNLEVKITSDDPENIAGEILIKGDNVTMGYYKNEEATHAVIDHDGWLHTGDIGTLSSDRTLYIKGRSKSMILSASGQNIYPEEIEAKLNNQPFVLESLIFEKGGKLIALVCPDYEELDSYNIPQQDMAETMDEVRKQLNKELASYETIAKIQLYPT